MDKLHFTIDDERVKHLSEVDTTLSKLIKVVGTVEVPLKKDYYNSLVKQIIGQQLSLKAAHTIISRVEKIWGNFDPYLLNDIRDEEIRSAGVSTPKLKYIRNLTEKHLSNEIDFSSIHLLNDKEVIEILTSVKGIGNWTAEMFLIFSLGRLDVLSYGDISIKNAIKWLYQIEKEVPLNLDLNYEKWKPYNTIVSLYLWKAIDLGLVKKHPNELELIKKID
ncbi:DNA-3-methyladenine glycosylase 2 family protein [Bacillus paranthracis]|uniref:DNA-3-methyladenine glycosylase family protein n=1 Tax=Bacillus paranthracis TaxID=2026186 RepID=UPI002550DCBE|nr:DNA-3-methyladenine glycosylase 2 family protein [Bacillus paranthracis]MDK7419253.1 DNA-3-methyladenine glycosylase 2 family protein [Bacillus paranthracis]MDK7430882.1 DNA-3-methyladenine glycosylase 2 family protein [Bacillus paranthracis]MDK7516553.1 DNA-3-methyladenine glycosylase 2 family protein [Bacillus paranthracis]MDK7572387.1 DNA-3-methyladenine glycosylase 2 family protein [Bacillus paranthracis]